MKLTDFLADTNTTQADFADQLGVTPGAVWQWCQGYKIAPENVLKIERATSGRVTRHELRPDIYPRDNAA